MRPDVEIEDLAGHAHLATRLATWHYAEFGHLYHPDVWNEAIAAREFEAMATPGSNDLTWVAFDGERRDPDAVLGSVSFVASDDLPGFEHLTPWLASLFVVPRARGLGVGSKLVDAALRAAGELGHDYVHLFTEDQESYYLARGWRTIAFIEQRGHPAAVMARATSPRGARRAVASRWCGDPDTNGAYSYLRVGGRPSHRERLADEIASGLWFAGEATSVDHPATMHGAWFSGERAADRVLASDASDVLIVGAGLAGLAAARRLCAAGRTVAVLEARDQAGGRITTDTSLGIPLPLGGAWLHGTAGHPLAGLVTAQPDDWGAGVTFVSGHGPVTAPQHDRILAVRAEVDAAFAAAGQDETADRVLAAVLATHAGLDPIVADAVRGWVTADVENLYAAPLDDFAPSVGFEPYALPGDDCLITSSLAPVIDRLAVGLDIRFGHRVARLTGDGRWVTDTGVAADAAIVTVAIGALQSGRIGFSPELPADVVDALDHIGTGPVTKLFATYDNRWWPTAPRPIRIARCPDLIQAIDMTDLTGVPTLCWFATGDAARRLEKMSEHEQCLLVDRVTRDCGLANWIPDGSE